MKKKRVVKSILSVMLTIAMIFGSISFKSLIVKVLAECDLMFRFSIPK